MVVEDRRVSEMDELRVLLHEVRDRLDRRDDRIEAVLRHLDGLHAGEGGVAAGGTARTVEAPPDRAASVDVAAVAPLAGDGPTAGDGPSRAGRLATLAAEVTARLFRDAPPDPVALDLEKSIFQLRSRPRLWDKVRLAATPNETDWALLPLPEPLYPLYYVLRPFRLLIKYGAGRLRR